MASRVKLDGEGVCVKLSVQTTLMYEYALDDVQLFPLRIAQEEDREFPKIDSVEQVMKIAAVSLGARSSSYTECEVPRKVKATAIGKIEYT